MNDFLKHYPKSDRRAVFALTVVAALLFMVMLIVDIVQTGRLAEAQKANKAEVRGKDAERDAKKEIAHIPLHEFDPNTVDSATLVGFGIAPWKARVLVNYRNKGKRFSTPEAMLDTYGWEQEDYELLHPYIRIDEEFRKQRRDYSRERNYERDSRYADDRHDYGRGATDTARTKYVSAKFKTLTKVDINTADSATLCSVPGVGQYISMALIRYRKRLGGFASVEQTLDIKQVSPELLEWFKVERTEKVKKININKDSFQKLNSHPYISYEQTRDLLMYRRLYGKIEDEAQLLKVNIFSEEDVERLRPYLEY
ncbi:MAG: helix-hairpin-helix domain-containing protein [Bacteroidaceae bacterium]|nr:helix-hairpin-helix domain-containing protein [Bacteroidaceae bacterium]